MEPVPNPDFRLVRNDAGQVSIWAANRPLPAGWQDAGFRGTRAECLSDARIRELAGTVGEGGRSADTDDPGTLVRMFADTVARHGSLPAVSDDTQALTYAELDDRSDALATELVERGVRPGDRVAIYRRRGVDVFVAILGVLKAGAAYVAVDSRYPDQRRDLMIEASGARITLVEPGWGDRVAHLASEVWQWRSEPGGAGAVRPDATPRADSAACLLFTSGSSGTPKAVVLEHRNLVMFGANPALPPLNPGDRTGQISSLSFDAFHFETWCSFAHGAEVVVLPPITDLIAADLQRELRRRRITAMLVPTMAVNQVIKEDRDAFAPLRVLHTGGDVLLPAACRDVLGSGFRGRFFNLYGPTEATTACTGHEVTSLPDDAGSVPIGTAVEGATVHVLDVDLQAVPTGQAGELHVGGGGVARGYHDQPALTAERFLPDPFGAPGARMYATGDLVRRREDGLLEFVGRVDDQVKIRGYRVEPGEVERLLCRHRLIREVAVSAAGEGQDKHLVAFVVLEEVVKPSDLRAFAAELLPDFMVPSSFITLPELPANDHGKRDWRRLDEIFEEHRLRTERHDPPRTEAERYLASLWEDLLGAERVGVTDDFFQLGGHSLLAFRAQRRIRRDLDVTLEFRDLLDNSVLGELASVVSRKQQDRIER